MYCAAAEAVWSSLQAKQGGPQTDRAARQQHAAGPQGLDAQADDGRAGDARSPLLTAILGSQTQAPDHLPRFPGTNHLSLLYFLFN